VEEYCTAKQAIDYNIICCVLEKKGYTHTHTHTKYEILIRYFSIATMVT